MTIFGGVEIVPTASYSKPSAWITTPNEDQEENSKTVGGKSLSTASIQYKTFSLIFFISMTMTASVVSAFGNSQN